MKLLKLSLSLMLAENCFQANAAHEKDQYNLFNPTPKELMRSLATDRPDKTESPISVDAGHFQIETDIVTAAFDRDNRDGNNIRSRGATFALSNIKFGLTNHSDIQFVVETYNIASVKDSNTGIEEEARGFGDVTIRYKQNLWGNDEGRTAFAVMPFVKIPSNQDNLGNNDIEGGVIFPFAIELGDFNLGIMTQLNINRNEKDNGYEAETFNSITVARGIVDNLSMFTELAMAKTLKSGTDWPMTFDMGLTYAIGDDIQLDAGAFIGLTESADDINPFLGITYRL
jgi:hypothetical protein